MINECGCQHASVVWFHYILTSHFSLSFYSNINKFTMHGCRRTYKSVAWQRESEWGERQRWIKSQNQHCLSSPHFQHEQFLSHYILPLSACLEQHISYRGRDEEGEEEAGREDEPLHQLEPRLVAALINTRLPIIAIEHLFFLMQTFFNFKKVKHTHTHTALLGTWKHFKL